MSLYMLVGVDDNMASAKQVEDHKGNRKAINTMNQARMRGWVAQMALPGADEPPPPPASQRRSGRPRQRSSTR
jgi:hypothetical protein